MYRRVNEDPRSGEWTMAYASNGGERGSIVQGVQSLKALESGRQDTGSSTLRRSRSMMPDIALAMVKLIIIAAWASRSYGKEAG